MDNDAFHRVSSGAPVRCPVKYVHHKPGCYAWFELEVPATWSIVAWCLGLVYWWLPMACLLMASHLWMSSSIGCAWGMADDNSWIETVQQNQPVEVIIDCCLLMANQFWTKYILNRSLWLAIVGFFYHQSLFDHYSTVPTNHPSTYPLNSPRTNHCNWTNK